MKTQPGSNTYCGRRDEHGHRSEEPSPDPRPRARVEPLHRDVPAGRQRDARLLQRRRGDHHRQAVRGARRDLRRRLRRGPRARGSRRHSPASPRLSGRRRVPRAPTRRTASCYVTGYDGTRRLVEATAYPLLGAANEMHGVVNVFWQLDESAAPGLVQARGLGMSGVARVARRRHRPLRRQHVVRRGAPRERAPAHPRRRHRHPSARRRDGRRGVRRAAHLPHAPAPRPPAGTRLLPPVVPARRRRSTSGDPASPVQSLADRIAIYLSPPLFPVRLADMPADITFHDAPEAAGHDRLGDRARRERRAPGPDGRLPDRGARTHARVPPRPRAVARRAARRSTAVVDQRARGRAGRGRAVARRAVRRRRVPGPRRVGALEHRARDELRRTRPTWT